MAQRGPLIRELSLPAHTLLALAARDPQRFPVLLDSAASGPLGGWSILAAFPNHELHLDAGGTLRAAALQPQQVAGFLAALEARWQAEKLPPAARSLPFTGGWLVYLGYEVAAEVEPTLRLPQALDGAPRAVAIRVPAALLYEHASGRCHAVVEAEQPALLEPLVAAAHSAAQIGLPPTEAVAGRLMEENPDRFLRAVAGAQQYIAAGDIYQANLSRSWQLTLDPGISDWSLYAALRRANPAPFAAWWQAAGLQLMSSSPERLLKSSNGRVETRPIAGTRLRSRDPNRQAGELHELLASPKERAEHVMLIDLERNDLGRVCGAGSVRVDEFMVTESYQHVHHIVSNVSGELRAGVSPIEVLRAVFPGGTITGCPKIRCMQLIAELEAGARGAYTGSVGYLNRDGSMDFNILIRTLTRAGAQVVFRAGAGIVADSDAQHELQETRAKARGLLRALGQDPP